MVRGFSDYAGTVRTTLINRFHLYCTALLLVLGISQSPSAHAQATTVDETHSSVSYQNPADWQTVYNEGAYGGSVAHSNVRGARVSIRFTGTRIFLQGVRCACGGVARIWLDGDWYDTVDTYGATLERFELYRFTDLADGEHVVEIEVQGERNSASTDTQVIIDNFIFQSSDLMQEYDANVTYTGTWIDVEDSSLSGGSLRASQEAGATARVTFTGTGITWIGYRCPCAAGIADVLAGSGSSVKKHTYAPSPEPQAEIYRIEGLPEGEHTLRIEVTGESAGANAWVAVDAFRVLHGTTGGGAETVPPTISMTSPEMNALVTGMVTLSASAEDNVGVTKVRFYTIDTNGSIFLGEDFTAPYAITRDTSGVPSGRTFTLWAEAYDAAGNLARSSPVFATVQHEDRSRPTVSITSPENGSLVSGTFDVTFDATDDFGIKTIELYRDMCCWNSVTFVENGAETVTVDSLSLLDGPHTLSAFAVDTANNRSAESAPVAITVDNSVQPGFVRIDEDSADVVFTGAWDFLEDIRDGGRQPMFHWGDAAHSATAGATATVTFEGTGIRWLGLYCDICGDATVALDGGTPQPVQFGASREFGRPGNISTEVYTSPVLPFGIHTLTITVVNEHPPGFDSVYIDGFEVMK